MIGHGRTTGECGPGHTNAVAGGLEAVGAGRRSGTFCDRGGRFDGLAVDGDQSPRDGKRAVSTEDDVGAVDLLLREWDFFLPSDCYPPHPFLCA